MSDMVAGIMVPAEDKECTDCRYRPLNWFDPPCVNCVCSSHWEAKENAEVQESHGAAVR